MNQQRQPQHSPFEPPAAPGSGQRSQWQALHAGAAGLAVARAATRHDALTVVVARDTTSAQRWLRELGFYAEALPRLQFPDWETLAYDAFSPHQDIVSERLTTLRELRAFQDQPRSTVLVVPVQTLLQRVVPTSYVDGHTMELATGQRYDIESERRRLEAAGYGAVETVTGRGEFAVRGSLMDIFPMGLEVPVRVDLFDDEIESLRTFDPETQRTVDRLERISVLPAREFPLDDSAIARFRDRWHNTFNVDVRRASIYQDVSQRIPPGGIEYFLPFFFDGVASLFDYLPPGTLLIEDEGTSDAAGHFLDEVARRFESLRHDVERPILPPDALYLGLDELNQGLNRHGRIQINRDGRHALTFATAPVPDVEANPRARDPAQALKRFLAAEPARTLFVADTAGRREVFWEFLARAGMQPREVDGFDAFLAGTAEHCITIAPLDEGLVTGAIRVVTESEVFGHQVQERRRRANRVLDPEQIIKNLTELHVGEPVVHVEHGIGRYQGLKTLEIDGTPHEFLMLEYAEQAKLYVPVTALHLISRYAGAEEGLAPLHRLGSDQWEKAKRRAAEKAYDVAAELLSIYARREANPRFAFAEPGDDYQRFAEQFPFELTPDQESAIEDAIADLCSERATDRLICGDVGFGKTEITMRAAFVACRAASRWPCWSPPPCSPSSTSTPCVTASPTGQCRSKRSPGCARTPR
ncbi:MAG: CarD family transcriptional regulator [Pseudomonadales bacterium]